jgi:simple sugar transport system ATP-binding protein
MRNIHKSFGAVKALQGVNFNIKPGEAKCLVGENGCGKSTLIKIISGVCAPDSGEIAVDGRSYANLSARQSIAAGIQVIYQDFSLFGNLTAAENIVMSHHLYYKKKWVNIKADRVLAKKQLSALGVDIDAEREVSKLSVGERQIVAICRALMLDARLVIMDEPTTALTTKEIEHLYKIIEGLKMRNIALIFVSHKLDEVFAVAESVCVLRDGRNVVDGPRDAFDKDKITFHMTGREVKFNDYTPESVAETPMFEVRDLSHPIFFRGINFQLHQGEILGITGLLGSGRTELAESIFGLRKTSSGEILLEGKALKIRESYDAVKKGIGYLPEDRLTQGLFLDLEIGRNISASIIRKFSRNALNITDKKGVRAEVARQVENLNIKIGHIMNPAKSLSGGNQQRIVLAKWLATQPKVLILNCPTVGVDVGSKSSIHETIMDLARNGIGIILISDDLPEILHVCNRILVINKGVITDEYRTDEIDESSLQNKLAKA